MAPLRKSLALGCPIAHASYPSGYAWTGYEVWLFIQHYLSDASRVMARVKCSSARPDHSLSEPPSGTQLFYINEHALHVRDVIELLFSQFCHPLVILSGDAENAGICEQLRVHQNWTIACYVNL